MSAPKVRPEPEARNCCFKAHCFSRKVCSQSAWIDGYALAEPLHPSSVVLAHPSPAGTVQTQFCANPVETGVISGCCKVG